MYYLFETAVIAYLPVSKFLLNTATGERTPARTHTRRSHAHAHAHMYTYTHVTQKLQTTAESPHAHCGPPSGRG